MEVYSDIVKVKSQTFPSKPCSHQNRAQLIIVILCLGKQGVTHTYSQLAG